MRNFLSIFALAASTTLFKILGIIGGLATVQICWFCLRFSKDLKEFYLFDAILNRPVFGLSFYHWTFMLAFFLIMILLIRFTASSGHCRPVYTLARLCADRRKVSFAVAVYAFCCLIILWAAQVCVLLILCRLYEGWNPESCAPLFFMTTFSSPFLHGLFPYGWPTYHLSNLLMLIGCGLAAGVHAVNRNLPTQKIAAWALLLAFLVTMPQKISGDLYITLALGITQIIIHLPYYIKEPSYLEPDEFTADLKTGKEAAK